MQTRRGMAWPVLLCLPLLLFLVGCVDAGYNVGARVIGMNIQYPPYWSTAGSHIVFSALGGLYEVNRDGSELRELQAAADDSTANDTFSLLHNLSPDGSRVVFVTNGYEGFFDLAVSDLENTDVSRLTEVGRDNSHGVWSPDGREIAYLSHPGIHATERDLYTVLVDGTGSREITPPSITSLPLPPAWSPDGEMLAFSGKTVGDNRHWLITSNRTGTSLRQYALPPGHIAISPPAWLHDGNGVAIVSRPVRPDGPDSGGTAEVHIIDLVTRGVRKLAELDDASPGDTATIQMSPAESRILVTQDSLVTFRTGTIETTMYVADEQSVSIVHTSEESYGAYGSWSPDGSRIAVHEIRTYPTSRGDNGKVAVFTMAPDGSQKEFLVVWEKRELKPGGAIK